MFKFSLVFICALLLAGCAGTPKIFAHSTKNSGDLERDKYDCRKDAFEHINRMGYSVNPMMGSLVADLTIECLITKHGWVEQKQ